MTTTMKQLSDNLLTRLTQADQVCSDCGLKYGKYSVGCSSVWQGTCQVCGRTTGVTEVRDYGYLQKGIDELKGNVKAQSKKVADYMLSVGPIMTDEELDEEIVASYEKGDITLKLTEWEVSLLNECLDTVQEFHPSLQPPDAEPNDVALFESIEQKISELYADHCIKYELSPALAAYNKKYGTWGTGEDELRWEGFRDAFNLLNGEKRQ